MASINATTSSGIVATADNTGTLQLQSAGTTVANITSTGLAVTGALTTNGVVSSPFAMKNRIINGDMRIAQRGTSFSFGSGGGTARFGADRFNTLDYHWSAGSNITISQDSTVYPTGFNYSYKWANGATGLTFNSGGYQSINQLIEGFNIADCYSKTVTLSFWVRSSTAGTYSLNFVNSYASYQRYIVKTYTISSANTWEYKTITVDMSAGTSAGTWNTTNGEGLTVSWILGTASDRTGNVALDTWYTAGSLNFATSSSVNLATIANSTFYLTGVQLEQGSQATSYEWLPISTELALCQRYFQKVTDIAVRVFGQPTNGFRLPNYYKVTMRANPTVTLSGSGLSTTSVYGQTPDQFSYSNNDGSCDMYFSFTASAEL